MIKHPILCLFMICIFTVPTAQPFKQLSAAELWNTNKSSGGKSKGSYYNKRRSSDGGKSTIYNRKNFNNNISSSRLRSNSRSHRRINISREQRASKLWKTMSPSAIRSRQIDTDNALQIEYNNRKRVRDRMILASNNREAYRRVGERRHIAALERVREKKFSDKQLAWKKRQRALQGIYDTRPTKKIYRSSRKKAETGLKKPKRLFNDPND